MLFTVEGLHCYLRKLELSDIELVVSWITKPDFDRYLSFDSNGRLPVDTVTDWLTENANEYGCEKSYMICKASDSTDIGLCLVSNIDWISRTAEYNYYISEPCYRNGYYGLDISLILVNFLFNCLNLNKLTGYTYIYNEAANKIHRFAGRVEGVMKNHRYFDGQHHHVIVYGLTRQDYCTFIEENAQGVLRKHIRKGLIDKPDC